MVSLGDIKRIFERDIKNEAAMGFKFVDFVNLFEKSLKKQLKGSFRETVKDISNKFWNDLRPGQKKILDMVKISAWDLIRSQSGGHPSITNISGLNFLGKGYVDFMKNYAMEIAKLEKANG